MENFIISQNIFSLERQDKNKDKFTRTFAFISYIEV